MKMGLAASIGMDSFASSIELIAVFNTVSRLDLSFLTELFRFGKVKRTFWGGDTTSEFGMGELLVLLAAAGFIRVGEVSLPTVVVVVSTALQAAC